MSTPVPTTHGRLIGIDFGLQRIGVAVCDPDRRVASPLQTYIRRTDAADARHFREMAREYDAVGWVVGLPLHADGRESQSSQLARAFAQWLTEISGLPAVMWDERFTTAAAENLLIFARLNHKQRRQRRDRVAAQLILQTYLDAGCPLPPDAPRVAPPLDTPPCSSNDSGCPSICDNGN